MKKTIKIVALLLVATLTLMALAACGLSPKSAQKALEKKGYTVTLSDIDPDVIKLFGLEEGDITASLFATKGEGTDKVHVTIVFCKNLDVARELWDNKPFKEATKGDNRGRVNAIIWYGMEQGWNDAQK